MVALTCDRDTAASAGNDNVAGVHHVADRSDLNDLLRFRGCYHTAVTASCIFLHDIIIFLCHYISLVFCHETADRLGRMLKCRIVGIHAHLCDHGRYRNIRDPSV